ncbi:unnamed protein product [Urochloa humidicola]
MSETGNVDVQVHNSASNLNHAHQFRAKAPHELHVAELVRDGCAGAHGERDLLRIGTAREASLDDLGARDVVVEGVVELLDD